MRRLNFAAAVALLAVPAPGLAGDLRVGVAVRQLQADDAMVIGGGIGPGKLKGQEGELRASALVIQAEDGSRTCLVACDVLMIERDVLDPAARKIASATGIPLDNILINCTHTHHAPTTVTIHGYEREEPFTRQVGEKIVEAAIDANKALVPVSLKFRLGEESSVGRNSRILLKDNTIYWVGQRDDILRPTGPFDPELPVLSFEEPNGKIAAALFNHSTHTIGTLQGAVRSPSFYGMAAQALEKEHGGTFLFFEGASGSTHNIDLNAAECELRIRNAVNEALAKAEPHKVPTIKAARKEIGVRVRTFDDARDDEAVSSYCKKRMPANFAESTIEVFRKMRKKLAPRQGEVRKTWIQAVVVGDIAFVGVPAEFFTVLGQDIKRRSPYRHTYIFELANDYIGYVGNRKAYELGGYQTWTGLHSYVAPGTGEQIVDESVALLRSIHSR